MSLYLVVHPPQEKQTFENLWDGDRLISITTTARVREAIEDQRGLWIYIYATHQKQNQIVGKASVRRILPMNGKFIIEFENWRPLKLDAPRTAKQGEYFFIDRSADGDLIAPPASSTAPHTDPQLYQMGAALREGPVRHPRFGIGYVHFFKPTGDRAVILFDREGWKELAAKRGA